MSRMLEALKQIEIKRPPTQRRANTPPAEDSPAACASVQSSVNIESETPDNLEDPYDAELTELHPIFQEELDRLHQSPVLAEEPIAGPLTVQDAISDSSSIDETLARAESAVASALTHEEPDVYEEMAQYILTELTPGLPAALLFTSPGGGAGQTEMLFSLSKKLGNHLGGEVFVLDALPNKEMQNEKIPRISGDWGYSLEKLKTRYQLVLIDAPSLTNAQTSAMISRCYGVYLLVRLGYATPYDVCEAVRVIQQSGGRLLGCIALGDARS
ncbi:MAG: hypothetical protein ABSA77_08565 [Thermoguttaceae bacterium]|jgi:hypothetical protein